MIDFHFMKLFMQKTENPKFISKSMEILDEGRQYELSYNISNTSKQFKKYT